MTSFFPELYQIRQNVVSQPLEDLEANLAHQISRHLENCDLPEGASIAIGCSSRGIANYAEIIGVVVKGIQARGYAPFLFPAMGSHGSATGPGQAEVLARMGISEETMGCPVKSSLDVEFLGELPTGMSVAIDRYAFEADAFVVVNRIKPHTEFTHTFESGLMKMMAIGMGKEYGATEYHRYFMAEGYARTIQAIAERVMEHKTFLFGVGIVEDGHAQTSEVGVVTCDNILEEEARLLRNARSMVPMLPIEDIDVLMIDEMGKDISGSGFDTKVVGRLSMPLLSPDPETPRVKRIVCSDLTDVSTGNADGVGIADFITERLYAKIDRETLYVNALAGSEPEHARIPMVMQTEKAAYQAAAATIGPTDANTLRLVRIRNTRDLEYLEVSSALIAECAERQDVEIIRGPYSMEFDEAGRFRSSLDSKK